jgi:hypothetical protein
MGGPFMICMAILAEWSNEYCVLISKEIDMKRIVVVCATVLLSSLNVEAQGSVTYLSNLGNQSASSSGVASDSWIAEMFHTGTNAAGYSIDSVQLAMTNVSGNPNGFTVMIYPLINNPLGPGTSLGTLAGSLDPVTAGIYTFEPLSSITLEPSSLYFVVVTAGTANAVGAYEWSLASGSFNTVGTWFAPVHGAGPPSYFSTNGLDWVGNWDSTVNPQYAIDATALPEPGIWRLFALGSLVLLWHRRKPKALR